MDDEGKKRLARARLLERHPCLVGFIDQNDTELFLRLGDFFSTAHRPERDPF